MADDAEKTKEHIENYFHLGYKYDQIVLFLCKFHGIEISTRTLKRRLQDYGLKRRRNDEQVNEDQLRATITQLISEAGSLSGYRTVWHALRRRYHVHVSRQKVATVIKQLDPLGVEARRARRLQRRAYRSYGPNFCLHMDGYDKLKPYGFPIHGAIDGYSRRIIWLEVVRTNNDPKVSANLFLKSIKENNGCPLLLWSDCGTENGLAASMQCYFRANDTDALAGENAHRYGSSHANQRIENWWSHFRRSRSSWWINFFKNLVQDGVLQSGNELHMECAWFCFSKIIQNELDEVLDHWNTHYIRRSRHDTIPGVPNVLYYLPELSDGHDYIVDVPLEKINEMEAECEMENQLTDYQEYFCYVMEARGLQFPGSANEALSLFQTLMGAAEQ